MRIFIDNDFVGIQRLPHGFVLPAGFPIAVVLALFVSLSIQRHAPKIEMSEYKFIMVLYSLLQVPF